jgi:hypothetical protein
MMAEAVKWGKHAKDQVRDYLQHEITRTDSDRNTLERKWRSDIIAWRARVVDDGIADIPFVGASDLPMPLIAMHMDPVVADFMQTLHAPRDFWSVSPHNSDMVDVVKPLQHFLSVVERTHLKMRKVNQRTLLDTVLHGTGIYKHNISTQRIKEPNALGSTTATLRRRATIQHVPLQDFFIPAESYDIDPDAPNGAAPWVAHRFWLSKEQLNERVQAQDGIDPYYDKKAVNAVMNFVNDRDGDDTVITTIRQEDEYTPWKDEKIELFEVWLRYDVDGDGAAEDVVITFHRHTASILRAVTNPFQHGSRPFEAAQYLPGFGFYGMGMAEIDEWAQRATERMLNNMLDNAFLANTVMIGAPTGSNIMADESIYPGKIWPLAPNETLTPIKMGQPYRGMETIMGMFMQWSEQRTGVNEIRQGDISSLPSRTPAATTQLMTREGNKRFDMILGNLRDGPLSNLGLRTFQNIMQISRNYDDYKRIAKNRLDGDDAQKVIQMLSGNIYDIEERVGFDITATSSMVNKEVDKQQMMFLAQYTAQVYPQLMQYAQMLGQQDPQLAMATVQTAYKGTLESFSRILEAHDIHNTEDYLPPVSTAPAQAPQPAAGMAGPAPAGPAAPQGGGPLEAAPAEMAALLGLPG